MSVLFFLKSKQADPKLEEYKRKVIEHLKSLDTVEKGGMATGTIREWKGKKYIKAADGKWRRYYNKESRGAKISIKHLIKKVEAIDTPEGLIQLMLLHRDRFSDENGHPIPLVQELSRYVSERQGKLTPKGKTIKPKQEKVAASQQLVDQNAVNERKKKFEDAIAKEEKQKKQEKDKGKDKTAQKDGVINYTMINGLGWEFEETLDLNKVSELEDFDPHLKMAWYKDKETGEDKGLSVTKEEYDRIKKEYENFQKKNKAPESKQEETKGADAEQEAEESEDEKKRNRSEAMKGNKNAYKGGPKPETKGEIQAAQQEEKKARKKAKMPEEKGERTSAMKDSTWNPKSEDYRYKDTGYIAGSRKEKAQAMIKRKAKEGIQVTSDEIDWEDIEENERIAEDTITKQNLMGKPDWEALKAGGMTGGAGYLINELYKTVGSKPENSNPESRLNFSKALDSLRSRMEACKTLEEVLETASEIEGERTGYFVQAVRTPEYLEFAGKIEKTIEKLQQYQSKMKEKIYEKDDPYAKAKEYIRRTIGAHSVSLFGDDGKWNGSYYSRGGAKRQCELLKEGDEIYKQRREEIESRTGVTEKSIRDELSELRLRQHEAQVKKNEELRLTNTMEKVWESLGKSFSTAVAIVSTAGNSYYSNKTFSKHYQKAVNLEKNHDDDYSWAEKKAPTNTGGGERKTQFELLVADHITRKGGRNIKAESTEDLKKAFNLRDVQSGNWVLNDVKSAKFHVENIAMGLADLADITGIPDDLVSLNGRLAMAIGARGHNKFLAHYESMERVINITKMKGGGSLAHEWFHAFDNLIAEAMTGGKYNFFLTETNDVENLSDKQQKILNNLWYYKRVMASHPSYRSDYERIKAKAKKAGIAVDEIESAEEHIVAVKAAFSGLVNAMMTGDAVKTKTIEYSKQDYEDAKKFIEERPDFLPRLGTEDGETPDIDAVLEKKKWTTHYENGRKISDEKKNRMIVALLDNNPEGGSFDAKTGEKTSDFYESSKKLDKSKAKAYWSKTLEMGARAFSAYIEDKLTEKGWENTYLTDKTDNEAYSSVGARPYPEGEEREAINAAFDNLFKAVKETGAIRKAIMADFILTVQKSENDKLQYFKRKMLSLFEDECKDEKCDGLKKSLVQAEEAEIRKSGRGLPVGTIRDWKGKKYVKVAPNKWRPKYDSHTRGAKMAISAIKKKIDKAKTAKELMDIVMENRERFSDIEGNPLPFVQELSAYVAGKQEEKKPRLKPKKQIEGRAKRPESGQQKPSRLTAATMKLGELHRAGKKDSPEMTAAYNEYQEAMKEAREARYKKNQEQALKEVMGEKEAKKLNSFKSVLDNAHNVYFDKRLNNKKNYEAYICVMDADNNVLFKEEKTKHYDPYTRALRAAGWDHRLTSHGRDSSNWLPNGGHGKGEKKDQSEKTGYAADVLNKYRNGEVISDFNIRQIENMLKDYFGLTPKQAKSVMGKIKVGSKYPVNASWVENAVKEAKEKPSKQTRPKSGGWENPLAKYPDIDPAMVARTIANPQNGKNANDPQKKKAMINDLVKKYGVSKEDAKAFVNTIADATGDDRYNARKYADKIDAEKRKKKNGPERVVDEDCEMLEKYVNGKMNRTEFRQQLVGKGYTATEINDIENFAWGLKQPTHEKPGRNPMGRYPNTGSISFSDGFFRFSDPTRDRTDPDSAHTGGCREIPDIKRRMKEMEHKGMSFVDEKSGEYYSIDEAIKQIQAGKRIEVGIKGKTLRREVVKEEGKVKKAVSEVLADIFN